MIELRGLHLGNIARSPDESVRPDLWPDHAWVPALGCTGGVVYDLCGGQDARAAVDIQWDGGSRSEVLSSSYDSCPALGNFRFAKDSAGTVMLVTRFTALTAGDSVSFGAWPTWADNNSVLFLGIDSAFKPSLVIHGGSPGTAISLTGAGALGVGEHRLACSFSSTYGALYADGGIAGTISGALKGIGLTTSQYYLGWKEDGTRAQNSLCSLAMVHRRQLNSSQILDLHADSLLPFRRRQQVYYSVPSGGGSVVEVPAAMMMGL